MQDQQATANNTTEESAPDYNSEVHWRRRKVEPFQGFYITRDDILELRIFSPMFSSTVNLTLRYMNAAGEILPRFETFTGQTVSGTPQILTFPNAEGFLISASIETTSSSRGSVFCILRIRRGLGSADVTGGSVLIAGYTVVNAPISYPESTLSSPIDGRGLYTSLLVGNPAAGTDWTQTVFGGEQWIVRAVRAVLVTSAAVANRVPHLQIRDGAANIMVDNPTNTNQAASLTEAYNWFSGTQAYQFDSSQSIPIPGELRLTAGMVIRTVTTAIQAADQWSAIVLTVERFISA